MTHAGTSLSKNRNSAKRLSSGSGYVYCGNWSDSDGDNDAGNSSGDSHGENNVRQSLPRKPLRTDHARHETHVKRLSNENMLLKQLRRNSSQFFKKTKRGVIGRIQFAAKIRVLTENEAMEVTADAVYFSLRRDFSDDGSVDINASSHHKIPNLGSEHAIDEETGVFGKAASPQCTVTFPISTKVGLPSDDNNNASFLDAREEELEDDKSVGIEIQRNGTDLEIASRATQSERLTICLEIEKCDLKVPPFSLSRSLTSGRFASFNPFVIIKLNGREIARTPALRGTNQPVWQDEIYEFPSCTNCGNLTFEVWNIKPCSLVAKDCIGIAVLAVQEIRSLYTNENDDEFLEFDLDLRDRKKNEEDGSGESCLCPFLDGEAAVLCSMKTRNRTYHNFYPKNWLGSLKRFGTGQGQKIDIPYNINTSAYKVENRDPYRRKELREFNDKKGNICWYKSSTTKALAMVACYMLIGIAAFSFIFEKKSLKHSLYLGVITFTTVGYG